ncbi:MAG: hypothetical protein ABW174_16245 [Flavitalea sp.]
MKRCFILQVIISLLLISSSLVAQKKTKAPKKTEYDPGLIMLNDSSVVEGFIKKANGKRGDIWFRQSDTQDAKRYRPSELKMYKRDSVVFHSLFKTPLYSYYASLGKTVEEPEIFGQLLSDGKIRAYSVLSYGSDVITSSGIFINYIFIKDSAGIKQTATLPIIAPVTRKRERIILADLEYFFQDYPKIRAYFRNYKRERWSPWEFHEPLIELIKAEG